MNMTTINAVQNTKYDLIVIGGGIIGTSTACEAASRGQKVLLIEKGHIGKGCSYGNAGWMTPCFAMPLPMPGLLLKSMKWMLDPEGPLYIKPSLSPDLAYWLFAFMRNMNEKQAARAIAGLVGLSKTSLTAYKNLGAKHPEVHFEQKGLLMVNRNKAGVAAALDEMHRVADHGIPGKALNSDEILALEPALKGPFAGGVYFPEEAMGEPLKVIEALASDLKSKNGVILEECEFLGFNQSGAKVNSISTTLGQFSAEKYVLATGSWSKDMSRMLGLRIPILGGKGYAIISPKLEQQPKIPIMYLEKKIAITPRSNSLRLAGTLELVDQDFSITERRVKAIERGSREILHLPEKIQVQEVWRGLRPCTPDGVPLIGAHPKLSNLYLNVGHQMLGLQTGYGSGLMMADIIDGKTKDYDMGLFAPDRF
jgi:D-amino-acid dehydrogenase